MLLWWWRKVWLRRRTEHASWCSALRILCSLAHNCLFGFFGRWLIVVVGAGAGARVPCSVILLLALQCRLPSVLLGYHVLRMICFWVKSCIRNFVEMLIDQEIGRLETKRDEWLCHGCQTSSLFGLPPYDDQSEREKSLSILLAPANYSSLGLRVLGL